MEPFSAILLILLLFPCTMSLPYFNNGDLEGDMLQMLDTSHWEESDDLVVVRRSTEPGASKWPMFHPASRHQRRWSGDTRKRYLPYHPVVRFRSPKPDFNEYPVLTYTRRYEDRMDKELSTAEILAILSTIMVENASQGRLKGLRFGISRK